MNLVSFKELFEGSAGTKAEYKRSQRRLRHNKWQRSIFGSWEGDTLPKWKELPWGLVTHDVPF